MVKDFKYIIRKIIIGVGICIAMYFFRNYLVIGVNAKSYDFNISKLESTTTGNVTVTTSPPTEFQQQGSGSYFGFVGQTTPNTNTWAYLTWTLQNNANCKSGLKNVSYIFTSAFTTPNMINRYAFTIEAYNGNKYSCLSDASNIGSNQVSEQKTFVSVMCPNIYFDKTTTYVIRAYTNGGAAPNAYWGITKPTFTDTEGGEIQSAINETNDTIKDDSIDNNKVTSDVSTLNSKNASNNSITQLLTLPITLYQSILNSVNGSCSSFALGSLLGTNLTMPCINLQNLLGSTLYGIIDVLLCGLFILAFRKKMVDIFNHMTSLNDRGNELE